MNCHCGAALRDHEDFAPKSGFAHAQHCFTCGCCYLADGVTPRAGITPCLIAQDAALRASMASISLTLDASLEAPAAIQESPAPTVEDKPKRVRR